MTVKSDLKKAVASAEAAKGTYAMFAESTDDPTAKAMFEQMQQDMQRHVDMLNGRLSYITDNNILYQTQQTSRNQQQPTVTGKGNPKIIQTDKK
jgi:rubrerythrin